MKRKILTALLSLVAAFSLWVYVVTVVSPEYEDTYRDIPVVFHGESVLEEREMMLICEETPTVTLHLSGNRSDLSKLSSSNITVTVDLAKVYETGKPSLTYNVSYPANVPQNAITILNRDPYGVQVEIVERAVKEVPVEVIFLGELPENYIKEKPELDIPAVQVKGPKSTVDQIASARVQIDLEGHTETIVDAFSYTLCDAAGEPVDVSHVETNAAFINVTLPVQMVKEVQLKLDVIYGGGATETNTTITLEYETIMISGSEAQLEGFDELLLGTLDLSQYSQDITVTFPIKLEEGITNETGIAEVKVMLDLPELFTKTVQITKINPVNVPDTLVATISTQEIYLIVRGTQEHLDALTEEHITVSVDFTGAQAGTDRFDADITVNSQFSSVGVVGTYTVLASLTEKQ